MLMAAVFENQTKTVDEAFISKQLGPDKARRIEHSTLPGL